MVRRSIPLLLIIGVPTAIVACGGMLAAQGGRGGSASFSDSNSFEVSGISVDATGKNSEDARLTGWRIAQRKGFDILSRRLTGSTVSLPDSALNGIVTGIVIEHEEIGPERYIARLGVLFSRARAGAILGVTSRTTRSAPMLVMPLQWSGGAGTIFERDTPWMAAWARLRTGNSSIDYIRPGGTGPDSLLLNAGQANRRGRGWWRAILDQYGASDVLIPQVRLARQWPGGPIVATFIAGHGPDNIPVVRFSLRVENSDGLPALLDEGVKRIDAAYQEALSNGVLRVDSLLAFRPPDPTATPEPEEIEGSMADLAEMPLPAPTNASTDVSIQFDTPSAAAVNASEAALRGMPGVRSAITTSLALGGVSVMRVEFDGDVAGLRSALETRGWQVQQGGDTLRIRRAQAAAPSEGPSAN